MDTPDWLVSNPTPPSPQSAIEQPTRLEIKLIEKSALAIRNETNALSYPAFFEIACHEVAKGRPLAQVIAEDHREFSLAHFSRWVKKDPKRQQEFEEAEAFGAELLRAEIINIADAVDNPMEDVIRSKLRCDVRWREIQLRNPKKYKLDTPMGGFTGGVTVNISAVEPRFAQAQSDNTSSKSITIEHE